MGYTKHFIVPDYYLIFECKCGDCRTTCCSGWGISLSMSEYFRLLGLECSTELRRRLDTAFHIAKDASPERYALVTPRFDGHCRIQADDGWCMLQRECGEEPLSAVCRYYPRAPRTSPLCECCTSSSCEKTLELLFSNEKPIQFIEADLTFDLPETAASHINKTYYKQTRNNTFTILADRTLPFTARFAKLGEELLKFSNPRENNNTEKISPLQLCRGLCERLAHSSHALDNYLPLCDEYYDYDNPVQIGTTARLGELFPSLDIYFEKLIINHIFYKGFPNSFDNGNYESTENHLADEFISLCAVFALTKYLSAAYMKDKCGIDDFVDVVAAAFRIIEHSRFDECAVRYLSSFGYTSLVKLLELINI
jgi:hypothetical protein